MCGEGGGVGSYDDDSGEVVDVAREAGYRHVRQAVHVEHGRVGGQCDGDASMIVEKGDGRRGLNNKLGREGGKKQQDEAVQ